MKQSAQRQSCAVWQPLSSSSRTSPFPPPSRPHAQSVVVSLQPPQYRQDRGESITNGHDDQILESLGEIFCNHLDSCLLITVFDNSFVRFSGAAGCALWREWVRHA